MLSLRRIIINSWHAVLRTAVGSAAAPPSTNPQKILLINGAHMGDVVIATSLLPVLKSAFPQADIGFLTGSWASCVVADHPLVRYTHQADHWRMNRSAASAFAKRQQYWATRSRALTEIRAVGYDVAICMHPWRADFLPLAWEAKIPVRLAFSESLFAPLATITAHYPELARFIHQSDCQLRLLKAWGIAEGHMRWKSASLASSPVSALDEVCALLRFDHIGQEPYCVIHMCAGCEAKEPPAVFWRAMAERLSQHQRVLFTGKGPREANKIADVIAGLPRCINACDGLSWQGLVAAVRHARTFYGVDSLAAHVAAAVGAKCIAMYGGMNNPARFRPESDHATVWTNALGCSGCNRQFGCAEMTCMQGFDADAILEIQKTRAA